jgi:hypothetical protein
MKALPASGAAKILAVKARGNKDDYPCTRDTCREPGRRIAPRDVDYNKKEQEAWKKRRNHGPIDKIAALQVIPVPLAGKMRSHGVGHFEDRRWSLLAGAKH